MKAPHTIVAYSNPFRFEGEIYYPRLIVKAKNEFEFYAPYHYCTSNISKSPLNISNRYDYTKDNASEWLTRFRRTVHFSDASDLTPVDFNEKEFGVMRHKLIATGINTDHMTYWRNKNGICFILIETYHQHPNYKSILKSADFSVDIIISEFSPYSGGWENEIGKQAGTTSYLICDSKNDSELLDITFKLITSGFGRGLVFKDFYLIDIPTWNSLDGIYYA